MKKSIKYIIILVLFVLILGAIYFVFFNKENDSDKFSKEYGIGENVFVYKTGEEIVKILENGTGIVYLGFPECPWCKAYVKILNDVALEEGIEKIYYFNIKDDRANNTEIYKEIVSLLEENLLYDEEGNKRIFVPDVTFVLDGQIIGHDNETSVISGDITPEEYWDKNTKEKLEEKLRENISEILDNKCISCEE